MNHFSHSRWYDLADAFRELHVQATRTVQRIVQGLPTGRMRAPANTRCAIGVRGAEYQLRANDDIFAFLDRVAYAMENVLTDLQRHGRPEAGDEVPQAADGWDPAGPPDPPDDQLVPRPPTPTPPAGRQPLGPHRGQGGGLEPPQPHLGHGAGLQPPQPRPGHGAGQQPPQPRPGHGGGLQFPRTSAGPSGAEQPREE